MVVRTLTGVFPLKDAEMACASLHPGFIPEANTDPYQRKSFLLSSPGIEQDNLCLPVIFFFLCILSLRDSLST